MPPRPDRTTLAPMPRPRARRGAAPGSANSNPSRPHGPPRLSDRTRNSVCVASLAFRQRTREAARKWARIPPWVSRRTSTAIRGAIGVHRTDRHSSPAGEIPLRCSICGQAGPAAPTDGAALAKFHLAFQILLDLLGAFILATPAHRILFDPLSRMARVSEGSPCARLVAGDTCPSRDAYTESARTSPRGPLV